MTVDKITNPPSIEKVVDKVNEVIDNLGGGSGGGANTDLSNLTATGEAHFQKPLVSGTNIKTINNTSLLGNGNIDTNQIFIAEYGTTTLLEVQTAYNAGKTIVCHLDNTSTTGKEVYLQLVSYNDFLTIFGFNALNDYARLNITLSSNGWSSVTSASLEITNNKVTSISSSSTNTQYPSAKAVWDNCLHSVSYDSSTQTLTIG